MVQHKIQQLLVEILAAQPVIPTRLTHQGKPSRSATQDRRVKRPPTQVIDRHRLINLNLRLVTAPIGHEVPRRRFRLTEQLTAVCARAPRALAQHPQTILSPTRGMSQAHPIRIAAPPGEYVRR